MSEGELEIEADETTQNWGFASPEEFDDGLVNAGFAKRIPFAILDECHEHGNTSLSRYLSDRMIRG